MTRYTKELRQEIIREFAERHDGRFNNADFIQEVMDQGAEHRAYEWFERDTDKIVTEYHLWQAREFTIGCKVTFTVETVVGGKVTIKEHEAPLVLSSFNDQSDQEYYLTDTDDPAHMAEYCRQADVAMSTWLRRYTGAVAHCGGSIKPLEQLARKLRAAAVTDKAA